MFFTKMEVGRLEVLNSRFFCVRVTHNRLGGGLERDGLWNGSQPKPFYGRGVSSIKLTFAYKRIHLYLKSKHPPSATDLISSFHK